MVIKQATGVQASVKVLGVKEGSQKGTTILLIIEKIKCHYSNRGPCASYGEGSKDNSPLHPEDQPKYKELWGPAGVSRVPGLLQRLQHLLPPPGGQVT